MDAARFHDNEACSDRASGYRPPVDSGHVVVTSDPFEALAESSDAIVFVTDLAMRMFYASSRLQQETGFTADDFRFPQADNPFIHREDADAVAEALSAFIASTAQVSDPIENRFLDRWGREHRYRSIVRKVTYRGETALLFVCRTADPAVATTDDPQYRALVEAADDAIVRLDNAGRFLFANRRTHELLGYTAIELGRLRLDDVIVHGDREAFTTALSRSVGTTQPVRLELRLVTRQQRELRVHAVLVRYGHVGELVAILRPL